MKTVDLTVTNINGVERDLEITFTPGEAEYLDGYEFNHTDDEIEYVYYNGIDITSRLSEDYKDGLLTKLYK